MGGKTSRVVNVGETCPLDSKFKSAETRKYVKGQPQGATDDALNKLEQVYGKTGLKTLERAADIFDTDLQLSSQLGWSVDLNSLSQAQVPRSLRPKEFEKRMRWLCTVGDISEFQAGETGKTQAQTDATKYTIASLGTLASFLMALFKSDILTNPEYLGYVYLWPNLQGLQENGDLKNVLGFIEMVQSQCPPTPEERGGASKALCDANIQATMAEFKKKLEISNSDPGGLQGFKSWASKWVDSILLDSQTTAAPAQSDLTTFQSSLNGVLKEMEDIKRKVSQLLYLAWSEQLAILKQTFIVGQSELPRGQDQELKELRTPQLKEAKGLLDAAVTEISPSQETISPSRGTLGSEVERKLRQIETAITQANSYNIEFGNVLSGIIAEYQKKIADFGRASSASVGPQWVTDRIFDDIELYYSAKKLQESLSYMQLLHNKIVACQDKGNQGGAQVTYVGTLLGNKAPVLQDCTSPQTNPNPIQLCPEVILRRNFPGIVPRDNPDLKFTKDEYFHDGRGDFPGPIDFPPARCTPRRTTRRGLIPLVGVPTPSLTTEERRGLGFKEPGGIKSKEQPPVGAEKEQPCCGDLGELKQKIAGELGTDVMGISALSAGNTTQEFVDALGKMKKQLKECKASKTQQEPAKELKQLQTQIAELETRIKECEDEKKSLESISGGTGPELERVQKELQECQKKQITVEKTQRELEQLEKEKESELRQLQEILSDAESMSAGVAGGMGVVGITAGLGKVQSIIENVKREKDLAEKELRECREQQKRLKQTQQGLREEEESLEDVRRELDQVRQSNEDSTQRLAELKSETEQTRQYVRYVLFGKMNEWAGDFAQRALPSSDYKTYSDFSKSFPSPSVQKIDEYIKKDVDNYGTWVRAFGKWMNNEIRELERLQSTLEETNRKNTELNKEANELKEKVKECREWIDMEKQRDDLFAFANEKGCGEFAKAFKQFEPLWNFLIELKKYGKSIRTDGGEDLVRTLFDRMIPSRNTIADSKANILMLNFISSAIATWYIFERFSNGVSNWDQGRKNLYGLGFKDAPTGGGTLFSFGAASGIAALQLIEKRNQYLNQILDAAESIALQLEPQPLTLTEDPILYQYIDDHQSLVRNVFQNYEDFLKPSAFITCLKDGPPTKENEGWISSLKNAFAFVA